MEKEQRQIIKIDPIEFKPHMKYPQIVWYRNLSIDQHLTQRELDRIKRLLKIDENAEISMVRYPDGSVFYQYSYTDKNGKIVQEPLVIIDLKKGTINTTQEAVGCFGLEVCQQQASQFLRILRSHNHAKFKQVVVSTYRLGDTPEQRKKILTAFNKLNTIGDDIIEGWVDDKAKT